MAFTYHSGPLRVKWPRKIASTAFNQGDLMYADGSGAVQPADSTSGDHVGVSLKTVAATDSDYASNTRIPVIAISDETKFVADVGTGTMTTALEQTHCDLTDADSIDVSATAKNVIFLEKFISSSKALVTISAHATSRRVATT